MNPNIYNGYEFINDMSGANWGEWIISHPSWFYDKKITYDGDIDVFYERKHNNEFCNSKLEGSKREDFEKALDVYYRENPCLKDVRNTKRRLKNNLKEFLGVS